MKKTAIAIIAIIVLAGGIYAMKERGWLPFGDKGATSNHAGGHEKETLYTCGMHPQIIQDHPGNCPICGMKLTPIRDGNNAGSDVLTIDPSMTQTMGVRTAVVELAPISRVIRATGIIEIYEGNFANVSSKVSGWIEKLYHMETGAYVQEGEALYSIYSPELVSAQREYLLSLNSGSETIRKAARKRLEFWDVPQEEIEKLKSTGDVSKSVTILAPRSGFIIEHSAVEGQSVMMGMTIFKIADYSTVRVNASIYENETPFVKEGMEAEMTLDNIPGKTFNGVIERIYPYLDETTRTVTAIISFPNPENELKPNMFATVRIESKSEENSIVVPLEAVLDSGERKVSFIDLGEGKFQLREVVTGVEDDRGRIQIITGLEPGEKVVTSGQFLLDSESRLREAVAKFGAGGGAHNHGDAGGVKTGDAKQESSQDEESGVSWPDPAKGAYVCPMESDDYYSDAPGICPKCGMDLVKTDDLLKESHDSH